MKYEVSNIGFSGIWNVNTFLSSYYILAVSSY